MVLVKFDYDDLTDSLIISKKKKTDKVKGSVKISNIILDLTKLGKVVGIEIQKFSNFLKEFNIKGKISELVEADISVKYNPDSIVVWFYVKFKNKEERRMPIFVSTERPQIAEIA